jgi:hypothetical protein
MSGSIAAATSQEATRTKNSQRAALDQTIVRGWSHDHGNRHGNQDKRGKCRTFSCGSNCRNVALNVAMS